MSYLVPQRSAILIGQRLKNLFSMHNYLHCSPCCDTPRANFPSTLTPPDIRLHMGITPGHCSPFLTLFLRQDRLETLPLPSSTGHPPVVPSSSREPICIHVLDWVIQSCLVRTVLSKSSKWQLSENICICCQQKHSGDLANL